MGGSSRLCPTAARRPSSTATLRRFVRQVRARCGLTQAAFAEKIEVPIETVRNWEQGKRHPRGPARALLKLIDKRAGRGFCGAWRKTALTAFGQKAALIAYSAAAGTRWRGAGRAMRISRNIANSVAI